MNQNSTIAEFVVLVEKEIDKIQLILLDDSDGFIRIDSVMINERKIGIDSTKNTVKKHFLL